MRPSSLLARVALACALPALLALPGTAAERQKTAPKEKAPARRRAVHIDKVEPTVVHVGERVTITGSGLDQATAVLLGKVTPTIVEQTPERLVFLAARDFSEKNYTASLFLVTPGQPILSAAYQITVTDQVIVPGRSGKRSMAIDEDAHVSAGNPKRYEFDLLGARLLELSISSKGGAELEAKIERTDASGTAVKQATYSGAMSWRVSARDFEIDGLKMPARLALILSTDAPNQVPFHASLVRLLPGTASKTEALPEN